MTNFTSRRRAARALARIALAAALLAVLMVPQAQAQQVFIGSANGWKQMSENPAQWSYVAQNSDGFYVNFIELLHTDSAAMAKLSACFAHKDAYYESDARNTGLGGFPDGGQFSRKLQAKELGYLLDGGFKVPYTSLNYGLDSGKEADLKTIGMPKGKTRPCFTQCGPWTYSGDILGSAGDAPSIRANIAKTDGASTDGPLSLWRANQGKMREGSFSLVKYVHKLHKTAAVMVAPYDLKPRSLWLSTAQECVRAHEDAGAKPDIWIVFEYATDTPTLPEAVDGKPADTITGMAYWLIHHVKDPQHDAQITQPANQRAHARLAAATASRARTYDFTVRNNSKWLDLCPVLLAKIHDPAHNWAVRFTMDGRDVTSQMTAASGLPFIGSLRLWPGDARHLQALLVCKSRSLSIAPAPPTIQISLRPNPSAKNLVNQEMMLGTSEPGALN